MVLEARFYLLYIDAHSGANFGTPLRLALIPSSSPTKAIPTPSSFSLTNPGTPPIVPTSCLDNPTVKPFKKLTLIKTPYKKVS